MIGVTVLPEYLQSEGVDRVLDNLQRVGVTAVSTSPYVMAPADEQTGVREPPADAGAGHVRLLDRPLWGKRELWVRTSPSFEPNGNLYHGLRYQPPRPDELTAQHGDVVRRMIQAARDRSMKVFFQVQAAIPPGYRVQFGGPQKEDAPRLPNGSLATRRVANNGSLASGEIVGYAHAMIRDLCGQYADIDGIRFDWPEYPPYFLDTAFFDFCSHARTAAERLGFDFEQMQADTLWLYERLHGKLQAEELLAWTQGDAGRYRLLNTLSRRPGLLSWLRFKATLVEELLKGFRQAMNESGAEQLEMAPNAFPPPWSLASGMNFGQVAPYSAFISVKLYGMHWGMMLCSYGNQLLKANAGLTEAAVVSALVRLLDIEDDTPAAPQMADYQYPAPDQPHPAGEQAQIRKIRQAQHDAGTTPIVPLAHGYGPIDDFRRRLRSALAAGSHGVWINRYGYLSDEKLEILREEVGG